jgi:hypothetical protein
MSGWIQTLVRNRPDRQWSQRFRQRVRGGKASVSNRSRFSLKQKLRLSFFSTSLNKTWFVFKSIQEQWRYWFELFRRLLSLWKTEHGRPRFRAKFTTGYSLANVTKSEHQVDTQWICLHTFPGQGLPLSTFTIHFRWLLSSTRAVDTLIPDLSLQIIGSNESIF